MKIKLIEVSMDKCKEFMTKSPACCVPNDLPEKAIEIMKIQNVSSIPVINNYSDCRLIGMVSDRDIALKIVGMGCDPKQTTLREIMSEHPVACYEEDDIDVALESMAKHQIRRIPVVDEKCRVTGMIAHNDVPFFDEGIEGF